MIGALFSTMGMVLTGMLFLQVVEILSSKGLILKKGIIVDSTIIAAPSSTKNKEKKRDKDAHSVKKGKACYFGYKAHIGVDGQTQSRLHLQMYMM